MEIYKLNYTDKETAIVDLLAKGVYIEQTFDGEITLTYGEGVQAVVEIGKICINEPTEEIPPIYADGYAYDVMCEQVIDFSVNEVYPKDAKHSFMGYAQNADGPVAVI
jgi:hypothetical protein